MFVPTIAILRGRSAIRAAWGLGCGVDGLDDLRQIVAGAANHLQAGGWLLMEHGYDQAEDVRRLLQASGFSEIGSWSDLAGIPAGQWRPPLVRLTLAERKNTISRLNYSVIRGDSMDAQNSSRSRSGNPVVLYMKGSPQFPQCGFSATVAQILKLSGVKDYFSVNVLADDGIRQGIKEFANWPTIPQLYVNGEFVGGCDIVREMYELANCVSSWQRLVWSSKAERLLLARQAFDSLSVILRPP